MNMRKRILVTGAGGYIGRHVVTKLCDMGADVSVIDFHTEGIDERAIRIDGNIFSGSSTLFHDLDKPDAVLHMAWRDGFIHNSDAHMNDLSNHYQFIHSMLDSGLKQLAVMGTMHEIGYHEGAIDENTPCNPISMYGISKDALRRSTTLLAKKYSVCLQWLRAFYILGDDKHNSSVFSKLCLAAESGKTHFPFTSGKNKYDFIRVDELATQISATIMQTKLYGIINCCTGNPVSLADKMEEFIREHGYSIQLDYGVYPDRAYDSPAIWGNATKIKKILSEYTN